MQPPPRITVEPLHVEHLPELAAALAHPAVYEHIGGEVPSLDRFVLGLTRALAGPPASRPHERWLNYLMRESASGRMIGRLEATVVPARAEVAFLVTPTLWGRGYASAGLSWLHAELTRTTGHTEFWATTVPANVRCQALLLRAGYVQVSAARVPTLASYDQATWSSTSAPPDPLMTITPTPITAAITGIVSAALWPLAWSRYGGTDFSMELVLATLLLIALPAHAFVVGFGYRAGAAGRAVDVPLLKRVGAWLLGAIVTAGLMALFRA